ncbi:MAG TPA: signal peptidase I [Solirubrobacteraceae bacterium]|nr:signal peptidase I [Solirubrobacteraceae bacterium]
MRRHLVAFACWLVVGAVTAALLSITVPYATGGRSYTVMSGGLEPRIHTGDVVGEERIVPAQMRSGDIVTFQDPDEKGRMITHRVRSVRERAGVYSVVTKGDANNTVERWTIAADGQLGRVRYRVAHVGHLLVFTRGPFGIMSLVVLPALLLGALELRRIWSRPEAVRT